jgi:hypothetical protein
MKRDSHLTFLACSRAWRVFVQICMRVCIRIYDVSLKINVMLMSLFHFTVLHSIK